jgi:hypothetical protein
MEWQNRSWFLAAEWNHGNVFINHSNAQRPFNKGINPQVYPRKETEDDMNRQYDLLLLHKWVHRLLFRKARISQRRRSALFY